MVTARDVLAIWIMSIWFFSGCFGLPIYYNGKVSCRVGGIPAAAINCKEISLSGGMEDTPDSSPGALNERESSNLSSGTN